MLKSFGHISHPREQFESLDPGSWHFSCSHTPEYADRQESLKLHCLIEKQIDHTFVCIFEDTRQAFNSDVLTTTSHVKDFATEYGLPCLDITHPWPLEIVRVEKPWGAEVWYTGIEKRGVCTANNIPLPWLFECLPESLIGSAAQQDPLLLKILDPLPDPALGNLYFELHDQKIEVYIVTHVDQQVWPDGVGKIRYGFSQEVRAEFETDEAFKAGYLDAVLEYQNCRQGIDELVDQAKTLAGIDINEPATPEQARSWLLEIPQDLMTLEHRLKVEMERYTHLRDIRVGDVIKVEPFFPHSLQHGVRVIEFQTASYERYILSFGQKVLTQSDWDTEAALDQAILSMPEQEAFVREDTQPGVYLETIADFAAFTAKRLTLDSGASYQVPALEDYTLLISASGVVTVAGEHVKAENARFIPANSSIRLYSESGCTAIIALPKS